MKASTLTQNRIKNIILGIISIPLMVFIVRVFRSIDNFLDTPQFEKEAYRESDKIVHFSELNETVYIAAIMAGYSGATTYTLISSRPIDMMHLLDYQTGLLKKQVFDSMYYLNTGEVYYRKTDSSTLLIVSSSKGDPRPKHFIGKVKIRFRKFKDYKEYYNLSQNASAYGFTQAIGNVYYGLKPEDSIPPLNW